MRYAAVCLYAIYFFVLSLKTVFKLDQKTRLVFTDVDGTISESDFKGHVFPYFGFTADHDYVVELFHKIAENGYKMVYLTARSIAQDKDTRGYLFEVST